MTDENTNDKEIDSEGQKINFFDLIINQRSDTAKIFDKYRKRIRKRKKKQYELDDDHFLEAEIIKEREEELKKALRAF